MTKATTSIATSTAEDVFVRGKSLTKDLIGKLTFTEMTILQVTGKMPSEGQTAVVDACLVTLMEHGLTPSVLASRLVYASAPEAMQAGIAAGLLAVGSVFAGTVEGCATLLEEIVAAPEGKRADIAKRVAEDHRAAKQPIPGFGHPVHKPDDPRTPCVLAVADDSGVAGARIAALRTLGTAVDAVYGKHLTINATGAVAAALADVGIPAGIMRGFAVLARCAGLVGHIAEERDRPSMQAIWAAAEVAVPHAG